MLSKHPFVRIAQIARIREYDMVKESDVKEFAGFLEFACNGIVIGASHHVAWRMVVAEDYARCVMIRTSTTVWLMPHFDMQESPRSLLA